MITFIPSWKNTSDIGESVDDLIGPIRSFSLMKKEYQIIIGDYIPNLRYFLHRFDLLESTYFSVFDELQKFENCEQKKLNLQDLDFPTDVSFIYSCFSVFVLQDGMTIGKIYFGEGGNITEVHHFKNTCLKMIEIYDDRGILSSRQVYNNEILDYTIYLDSDEKELFTKFELHGDCVVNLENCHNLKKDYYEKIEEIQFELIKEKLLELKSPKIIVSLTNENINFLNEIQNIGKNTLSIFKSHYKYLPQDDYKLTNLTQNSQNIIFDSITNLDYFLEIGVSQEKLHRISPFDTRFRLSVTQELKSEVIYIDARNVTEMNIFETLSPVIKYIDNVTVQEARNRTFKLIVRVSPQMEKSCSAILSDILNHRFPIEMSKINKITDEPIEKELQKKISNIKKLVEGIEIKVIHTEEDFFKIIDQTRLIIDLSKEPDLFTQIAGISAGIPQINAQKTEYVEHQKNGIILEHKCDLEKSLIYYLEQLKHWQKARMYAIQKIKEHSGLRLLEKLSNIWGEEG